jgi:uncharacterized protein
MQRTRIQHPSYHLRPVRAAEAQRWIAFLHLLDKGANINANDAQGHTALIDAALLNHRDVARLLVSRGADVNTPSDLVIHGKKTSLTALTIARSKGHQDIVMLLTEAGAK